MVLAWCKVFARAIRGRFRTEAQPEPLRSWRGEPLPAVGKRAPSTNSYRTLFPESVAACRVTGCGDKTGGDSTS
jgi:hypothetical protein